MPQVAWPRMTKVVRRLLIANAAVFVASFLLFFFAEEDWRRLELVLGLRPAAWRGSFPILPAWQLLTYGFLHSVTDIFHVLGNLLMLYFFGTMLEEILGSRRFLVAYLSAQLVGALFFLVPGLFGSGAIPVVGASGAVYGVMIAVATMRPNQTVFLLFIPVTMRVLALVILAITVFGAALAWKGGGDGVAHLVHLGGIAYGYLAVKTGLLFRDPVEALERRRAEREVERGERDEQRMDRLLEKIHREGMAALTRSEREFLKRISSRR